MDGLVLEDILLSFYGRLALEVEDFMADAPFALLGCGGAGKTNFIKVVAGLEFIEKGRIYIFGDEVGETRIRDRGLSLISRQTPLFERKTVRKNLEYPLKKHRMSVDARGERVAELSREYGLESVLEKRAKDLTKRERAAVYFARAMAKKPRILLLDEIGVLDMDTDYFLEMLKNSGVFYIFATYDFEKAQKSGATRFVFLRLGSIIFDGTIEDIKTTENQYIKSMCFGSTTT